MVKNKGNCNSNVNSRSPSGMTSKKSKGNDNSNCKGSAWCLAG